jgi:putative oxidoreductase
MPFGLLVLRLALALTLFAHGSQKLFGWFGGPGLAGTRKFFEGLGFHRGKIQAVMAGVSEVGAGLLLALGFLVPLAAAPVVAMSLVAAVSVHSRSFFIQNDGWEYLFMLSVIALVLTVTGPGLLSVDDALGLQLAGPAWGAAALIAGVGGGFATLAMRHGACESAETRPLSEVRQP